MGYENCISNLFKEICKLNQPELLKITQEYYELIITTKLSEEKIERMAKILDLAVFDRVLDEFISNIDKIVKEDDNNTILNELKQYSQNNFVHKIEEISNKNTIKKFENRIKY